MDKKKRVGVWIRVSTEDQAQGESPEHHERRARAYAQAKDWQVVEVYDLAGFSGKTVADHPETRRMMDDVASGRVEALIFSKLARLARNTRELLDFADFFRDKKADLVSLDEAIDTSTPAGRLFYTVIAAMAQWEREEISERVKKSVKVRAEMGKPLGGAAPFGYQWQDGKLTPDPQEAPVRRLMYELFAELKRVKTVARRLNEAGHRTRRGAKFSATTVRRLLEDPTAKGLRRANWTESRGDGLAWDKKPEEEWIWSEVEPVVSEELWEECNAVLSAHRAKRAARPAKRVRHLFAGVVLCADCATKMYVPSKSAKYTCQECRRKLPGDDLEKIFIEQLRGLVLSPDAIAAQLEAADEELSSKRSLQESLRRDRDEVLAESEKLYRLYLDEEISSSGFGRKNKPLEERLEQLDEEIPRLQAELDFLSVQSISREEIVSEARDLYFRWESLSFGERRAIVETLTEEILVGEEEIEITLNYLSDSRGSDDPPVLEAAAGSHRHASAEGPDRSASPSPSVGLLALGTSTSTSTPARPPLGYGQLRPLRGIEAKREQNCRGSSPPPGRTAPGSAPAPSSGRRSRTPLRSAGGALPGCRAGTPAARPGRARRSGRGSPRPAAAPSRRRPARRC